MTAPNPGSTQAVLTLHTRTSAATRRGQDLDFTRDLTNGKFEAVWVAPEGRSDPSVMVDRTMLTTEQIAQTFLTQMAQSMATGDFDQFRSGILLPFTHTAGHGIRRIATIDALREGLNIYSAMFNDAGADGYSQTVSVARLMSTEKIVARFEVRITQGDIDISPRYMNWLDLRKTPLDGWKAQSITSFYSSSDLFIKMPFHLENEQSVARGTR